MDLSLWDPPDDQVYFTSINNYPARSVCQCGRYSGYGLVAEQSSRNLNDKLLCEFCPGYDRDMIEEDALNKKFCLQALKISSNKADEDIRKHEEDTVRLPHCQLASGDENWSKPCSAFSSEKFDHPDVLIQHLKKERTEDVHHLSNQSEQPVELPPRFPNRQKHYLEKSEQTENLEASISKYNKKIEEKECTTSKLDTNEMNSQSMELEERKLYYLQQNSKANASAHVCATNKLSERDMNMPNTNLSLANSGRIEPSSRMVMDSIVEQANSREERRNNDEEVIKGKVTQHGHGEESNMTNLFLESVKTEMEIIEIVKVECMGQTTEASSEVPTARVYRQAIKKNVASTKPSSAPHNSQGREFMLRESKGPTGYVMKLMNPVCDTTREDGADGGAQNPSPSIKDVKKLRLVDLRVIARERGIPRYSKLNKAELLKSLGLEPSSSDVKKEV